MTLLDAPSQPETQPHSQDVPESAAQVQPLSLQLRSSTRSQHEHAETRSFVTALMGGGLGERGREAYIDLARQHHAIYRALEAAGERLAADPVVADFLIADLLREASLVADLEVLAGADWRDLPVHEATAAYVARLDGIEDAESYVAHAYTRYLGDLSGGQAIAVMLQRHYGLTPEELTFYRFDGIPKPKVFKDTYRELLDAADLSPERQARAVAEAQVAFDLNAALFVTLGERHGLGD